MKGIALAGGTGSCPVSFATVTNKHCLPASNYFMAFHLDCPPQTGRHCLGVGSCILKETWSQATRKRQRRPIVILGYGCREERTTEYEGHDIRSRVAHDHYGKEKTSNVQGLWNCYAMLLDNSRHMCRHRDGMACGCRQGLVMSRKP